MDNRRVIKAYKDRGREKFLPLPSKAGLLLKMKRYISGSSLWQDSNRTSSANSSRVSSRSASRQPSVSQPNAHSLRLLSESFALAANQSVEQNPDHTANEVLSNFFKEKGDRPLSQIEYEGVMSLLEKSKANITMPSIESDQQLQHTGRPQPPTRDSSFAQHNTTFSTQRILKNTSMYDGSHAANATFSADYKPKYNSINDSTRAVPAVKRVYQFSGLPSPYRTRIRTPSQPQKKARRIATESAITSTSSLVSTEPETIKPKSNTANSLLSVLDSHEKQGSTDVAVGTSDRPLHNPYAKNRRRTARTGSSTPAPFTTADDISKTIAFNQAKDLAESPDKTKNDSLFTSPARDESKVTSTDAAKEKTSTPLFTFKPSDAKPVESKPAFSFNLKNTTEDGASKPEQPKPDANGFLFDSQKPLFSFASKSADEKNAPAPKFEFKPPKESDFKPRDATENDQTFASPTLNLDKKGGLEETSKPSFNFAPKSNSDEKTKPDSRETKPFSLFGNSGKASKPFPSFGAKATNSEAETNDETTNTEETELETNKGKASFKFGVPPLNAAPKDVPRSAAPMPVFNFGAKAVEEETEKKPTPAFSFGSVTNSSSGQNGLGETTDLASNSEKSTFGKAFSFGKAQTNQNDSEKEAKAPPKPAFSFGTANSDASSSDASNVKDQAKPAFSFGSTTSKLNSSNSLVPPTTGTPFSFGKLNKENSSFAFGKPAGDQPSSGFAFNTSEEKSTPSAFLFGAPKEDEKKESKEKATSAFSFGEKKEDKAPPSLFGNGELKSNQPAFQFGKTEADKPTSAFSFGKKDEEKKTPTFSFGSSATKNDTPLFGLGKTAEVENTDSTTEKSDKKKDAPAFSFGLSSEDKTTPSFNFGEANDTTKTPAFSFGKSDESKTSGFSFGKSNEAKSSGFSFGKSDDKSAFQFGKSEASNDSTKADSDDKKEAASTNGAKSAFNFGSNTKDKPAFNFGSTNTPAFGSKTTANDEKNGSSEQKFEFPELEGTDVTEEDKQRAEEYKSLFKF